ncbi:MAG: hypothetical protein K2Q14_05760 [Gammaproteobacteria bacterium]|nr:hypothetical protein [Gammaproteobacteria bacterium]
MGTVFNPSIRKDPDGVPYIDDPTNEAVPRPANWFSNKPVYVLRRNVAEVIFGYIKDKIGKELGPLSYDRAQSMTTTYIEIINMTINEQDIRNPVPFINNISALLCEAALAQESISVIWRKEQYLNPESCASYFHSTALEVLKLAGEAVNHMRKNCELTKVNIFENIAVMERSAENRFGLVGCNIM